MQDILLLLADNSIHDDTIKIDISTIRMVYISL